jgi:putative ABC transport system permease protein
MSALLQDLRFAVRTMRRTPLITGVAVLTLALGIGLNGVMFGIVNSILWKPWPVQEPDRLAILHARPRADGPDAGYFDFSYADYRDFHREATGVFEDLIAYYPLPLSFSGGEVNERIWGEIVSPNYFQVLGVKPAAGRTFLPESQGDGGALAVVLSHAFWERRFGSDPTVLGRAVKLNGRVFTVSGVAPPDFHGIYYYGWRPALWISAGAYDQVLPADTGPLDRRGATTFRIAGRLRPGATIAQASTVVRAVGRELEHSYPETNGGSDAVVLSTRDTRPEPGISRIMTFAGALFLALAGLVLLVACANVASLLLARANARRREIAVRLSLGASGRRLMRQLLTESILLALLGGLAGLLLALWAGEVLSSVLRLPTDIPFVFDVALDLRAIAFISAVTGAAALVFGVTPARMASSPRLTSALRNDDTLAWRGRRFRTGDLLVVGQIAVTCVLLVLAGLGVRSLARVADVDPGFSTDDRLVASVSPALQGYDADRGTSFYRRLLDQLQALPGVRSATLVQYVPLDFSASGGGAYVGGESQDEVPSVFWAVVGPSYFETLGTPLHEGRAFTIDDDRPDARRVAVVSETLARRFWPEARAIGRTLRLGSADAPPVEVVGVAADVKVRTLTESPQPLVYLPLGQNYRSSATLVIHSAGDALALAPAVRGVVRALDPEMPLSDVKTLEALVRGRGLFTVRFAAVTVMCVGALALVLAVVGLYGVTSYAVTRRVRDIGIRMALGAGRQRLLRGVLGDGLRLAVAGVLLGIMGALAVARLASALLFGVSPADPLTFTSIAILLISVALLASFAPARRATRVDPVRVLRQE